MDFCQEWSPGPIVVDAGPSGLAVAALLAEEGIPSLLLELSHCIALKFHLPEQFCELPLMPFPSHFPKYPSKQQFVDYLESYAENSASSRASAGSSSPGSSKVSCGGFGRRTARSMCLGGS